MKIYEGRENFIFISYAHADSNKVVPIIEELDSSGFRVWYDSGIEAGSEWPITIANHVKSCHRLIFFASRSSINSKNCRNEVNLALSHNKEILVVYLENVELGHGLDLQLSTNQAMFRNKYPDVSSFVKVLNSADILAPCKSGSYSYGTPSIFRTRTSSSSSYKPVSDTQNTRVSAPTISKTPTGRLRCTCPCCKGNELTFTSFDKLVVCKTCGTVFTVGGAEGIKKSRGTSVIGTRDGETLLETQCPFCGGSAQHKLSDTRIVCDYCDSTISIE